MLEQRTQPLHTRPRPRRTRRARLVAVLAAAVTAAALFVAFSLRDNESGPVEAAGTATASVVFDRSGGDYLRQQNADARFRSASLVKLLIGIDLVQRGIVTPANPSPRMTRMLSFSDDALAQQLWTSGGGPEIVARTARSLGLHATPPAVAHRWGDTLISADDVVAIYRFLYTLPASKRSLVLDPLRDAAEIAADGTDQYFGIPSGLPGQRWAIKQGWAAGRGGVDAHTSGLVGTGDRYIVVVLTHHPEGTALADATRQLTATTAALAPLLR